MNVRHVLRAYGLWLAGVLTAAAAAAWLLHRSGFVPYDAALEDDLELPDHY